MQSPFLHAREYTKRLGVRQPFWTWATAETRSWHISWGHWWDYRVIGCSIVSEWGMYFCSNLVLNLIRMETLPMTNSLSREEILGPRFSPHCCLRFCSVWMPTRSLKCSWLCLKFRRTILCRFIVCLVFICAQGEIKKLNKRLPTESLLSIAWTVGIEAYAGKWMLLQFFFGCLL